MMSIMVGVVHIARFRLIQPYRRVDLNHMEEGAFRSSPAMLG